MGTNDPKPLPPHGPAELPESFPDRVNRQPTNVPPLPPRRRDNLDTGPVEPRPQQAGESRPTRSIITSDKD